MKIKKLYCPFLIVSALLIAIPSFAADGANLINSTRSLQARINFMISDIGRTASASIGRYAKKGEEGYKVGADQIKYLDTKCELIKGEIAGIRKLMPGYQPTPINVGNPFTKERKKLEPQIKTLIKDIKDYNSDKAKTIMAADKLSQVYEKNVCRESLKVFLDHFDLSKGGVVGMYLKHGYARISGQKTEYEKDAEILKRQKDEIIRLRKDVIGEYDKRIAKDVKEKEELDGRLGIVKKLEKGLDEVFSKHSELFGSGSGSSDEQVLDAAEGINKENAKQEAKNVQKEANSAKKNVSSIISSIREIAAKIKTKLRWPSKYTDKYVADFLDSCSTLSIRSVDVLEGKALEIDKFSEQLEKVPAAVDSARSVLAGKWASLPEKVRENNFADYNKAVGKLAELSNKAQTRSAELSIYGPQLLSQASTIRSKIESQAGDLENARGIVKELEKDGTPVVDNKQVVNEVVNNFHGGTYKPAFNQQHTLYSSYHKISGRISELDGIFKEILSYGVGYWHWGRFSERPDSGADCVDFPIASKRYGTQDKKYPVLSTQDYQDMYNDASSIQAQIEREVASAVNIVKQIKKINPEDGLSAKHLGLLVEENDKILKLYSGIIGKAASRDRSISEAQEAWKEGNAEAKRVFARVTMKYDGISSKSRYQESTIQDILGLYEQARDASSFYPGLSKDNQKTLENIQKTKEALITKWQKQVVPKIYDIVIQNMKLEFIEDKLQFLKDNLRDGAILISGGASPAQYAFGSRWNPMAYTGARIKRVEVSVDGGMSWKPAKLDYGGDMAWWDYEFRPARSGNFIITARAIDMNGNISERQDFPRVKIDFINTSYKEIAQEKLDQLKESYEEKNTGGFLREISDDYYGDRNALEDNLRSFFKYADNISLQLVVDLAQRDRDNIIVNFHWNKSYLDTRLDKVIKGKNWETIILSTAKGNKILKTSPTMFGVITTMVIPGEIPEEMLEEKPEPLPHGIVVIDQGGDFMFEFATGEVYAGQWMEDPYDIVSESWGAPTLLLNHDKNIGIKDMGAKSIDDISEVPTSGYNYDSEDNGIVVSEGRSYAVVLQDKKYALFEVLEIIAYDSGSGTQYKIRIEYKYQPDGSNKFW